MFSLSPPPYPQADSLLIQILGPLTRQSEPIRLEQRNVDKHRIVDDLAPFGKVTELGRYFKGVKPHWESPRSTFLASAELEARYPDS